MNNAAPAGHPRRPTTGDPYLGLVDLLKRWSYTRAGIRKLNKKDDFLKSTIIINYRRIKVWTLADVEACEKGHLELLEAQGEFIKQ